MLAVHHDELMDAQSSVSLPKKFGEVKRSCQQISAFCKATCKEWTLSGVDCPACCHSLPPFVFGPYKAKEAWNMECHKECSRFPHQPAEITKQSSLRVSERDQQLCLVMPLQGLFAFHPICLQDSIEWSPWEHEYEGSVKANCEALADGGWVCVEWNGNVNI